MGDTLSKPWLFIAATALFCAFAFTVLPAKAADAALYTPAEGGFDTSLFYTPAQAMERALAYGEEGRAAYIFDRWTFDLAFPIVYGLFMLSAWAFSIKRLAVLGAESGAAKPAYIWLLVPALGVAFDFAENAAVTLLMLEIGSSGFSGGAAGQAADGPFLFRLAAFSSSAATALKWLFVGSGFAGAILLPPIAGLRALSRARGRRSGMPRGRGSSR